MVLCELENLQGDRLFELKEVFPLDYGWRKFGLLLLLHAVIRSNRYHLVGGPGRGHTLFPLGTLGSFDRSIVDVNGHHEGFLEAPMGASSFDHWALQESLVF